MTTTTGPQGRGLTYPTFVADPANPPNCRGLPTDDFYPVHGALNGRLSISTAKNVCRNCELREACLEYALNLPEHLDHGVWGATTKKERRRMRIRRGGT